MTKLPADVEGRLTKSFRFGPVIAENATKIIELVGETVPLRGFEERNSSIGPIKNPRTILFRTNAAMIEQLMQWPLDRLAGHQALGGRDEAQDLGRSFHQERAAAAVELRQEEELRRGYARDGASRDPPRAEREDAPACRHARSHVRGSGWLTGKCTCVGEHVMRLDGLEVLLLVYCTIGLVIGLFAWVGLKTIELAEEKLDRRLTNGELAACLFLLPWSPFYVVFVLPDYTRAQTRRMKVYSNGIDYLSVVEDR